MPKRRAARGRRGGGNVDRKVAKAVADESDTTEVITDLDGATEAAVGIDESEVAGDSENEAAVADEIGAPEVRTDLDVSVEAAVGTDESEVAGDSVNEAAVADESDLTEVRTDLDGSIEAAVGIDESEVAGDGVNEAAGVEDAADDNVTDSVLQEQTVEENEDPASETNSEGNVVTAAVCELAETDLGNSNDAKDVSESTSVDDIIKEGSDAECTVAAENNEVVERDDDAESSMVCQEENKEIDAEKCQQLEASEEGDQPANESEHEMVEDDPVKNSVEEECQASEEPRINFDGNEVADMDVSSVDKEAEGDQTEEEEVQYIDEEASEDQQSTDPLEVGVSQGVVAPEESELQGKNEVGESIENPIELDENDDVSAGVSKTDLQKDEENDNSKFEEISEGSIDQDQEELIAEPISDVEIIGESFEVKKVSKSDDVSEENTKPRYKEAESLEEVFFATENDDLKITAEDKDNDDVSDTSLSNHADANLSLEEISDDDLEPSKKRKKSGVTPVKADKTEEKTAPDVDRKSVEKSEVKPNQKSMSVQKRPANDEGDNAESISNKRLKTTNETKDSEGTPSRSENDVTSDTKKDGKKPQAKEIDTFQGRSVPHNRNLSQSSKNGRQESRERAISSRDSVERKKRHEYELVSTMSQTEPRQLKGKIVQCNINPVRVVPEPSERISENNRVESRLLTRFRKQIPSSIPEKIFLAVTSLHPPQLDNAYSFSMGPVTLSDIDCPKFRLTMRNMEDFSLTFDKHTQGIQKATLASHESLTSLIGHLKNLELGNRYMVMSVVYKCGVDRTVGVWKATLLFMYEQDIQMESLKLVNDGKVRAKLCLKGVPKDVSKDFIHLLFPEAINVCTGQGNLDERTVILGFSNEKIVEEIVSCYDLLVICGSQINISRVGAKGTQQGLPPDGSEESKAILVEDIQNGGALEKRHTNESIEKETEKSELQKDSQSKVKNIVIEDSKKEHITQSGHEAAALSEVAVKTQEAEKNDSSTGESKSADSKDSCAEVSQTTSEVTLAELIPASDVTAEGDKLPAESVADTSTKMQTDEVPEVLSIEKGQQEKSTRASSTGDESSASLAEAGIDKPSDSQLGDVALLETTDNETSKPVQENNADSAVTKVADGSDKMDVDNPSGSLVDDAGKDSSKLDSDRQDSEGPEVELLKTAEAAPDTIADVTLAGAATDSSERKIDDESSKTIDSSKSGKEGNQGKLDKNFEDISDEEAGNQSKRCEPDDVVIVTNESPQLMVTEIDLTVEEFESLGIIENVTVKPLAEEKAVQPSSKTEEQHDNTVKKAAGIKQENVEPKLVMTDGDLEISMEVIDVNENEQQTEKVIYARTYKEFRGRSRERKSWDARSYKTTSYAQPPWRENNWPEINRPAPYYGSHEPYKHYPPKESAYRVPYYPPLPAPLPEELSYYRAPARESTSYRREPYYLKPKRYRSPSPSRDANLHRHSSSRYSDHRTGDHWSKRYDSWQPSAYEDSKKSESYSRPPAEYSGRQAHWQSHSASHRSPPPSHESLHSSARPKDRYSRGGSRDAYDSDRRRKYRKSRSRSLSDMSISSAELVSPVRKSYRRESPKRPAAHTSRSPISVSSRSRSLSPVSKSPSVEYTHPGTGKDKLVKTVKHFLELAKGIKQTHRRQSNRSQSPKSPLLRRSKSPLHSRHRSPSVSSSLLRKALHGSPRKDSRRQRSRSPHQLWSRSSRSPTFSKRCRHDRSSSRSSHGDDYKRRYKERGSYHRQSPDPHYESRKPQKTETSHAVNDQISKSKSAQWPDSKYKSGSSQSWQQPFGSFPVPQSSGSAATSSVYNPTYPPPGCPPQPQTSVYSGSSVSVYPYSNPSQFYSNIPPPYLHVPPPAPIAQTYQPPAYTVYQPPQPYASLQTGSSSTSLNVNANNASSKTKSWSMGSSAMVFQRVLGPDRKGGKVNKSGVISKIVDRERLERPKVAKTERVLTTIQMQKK